MRHVGRLIQQRREAMQLSQAALSREMGGYPSASLMSRIESGDVDLTPRSAAKYAEALRLPRDPFMNAAGLATPDQMESGLDTLSRMLGVDVPVFVPIPVLDVDHPTMPPVVHRTRELRKAEDVFIVDMSGAANAPFIGEVLVSRARKPKDGDGVIAEVMGKLGAWRLRISKPTGEWLENGKNEKATKFKVLGVVIRYTTAFEME